MEQKIKHILRTSRIEAKWLNCGAWTKEIFSNLLEFCEMRKLKITKKGDSYNLKIIFTAPLKFVKCVCLIRVDLQ